MIKHVFILLPIIITLTSCIQATRPITAWTIILDGEKYTEKSAGDFVSWSCVDYVNDYKTVIEVGITSSDYESAPGFVLFDGTNKGIFADYMRDGINHRWNWGEYAFLIKPDGTGLYYDFSGVGAGESTTASDVFKCSKY